MRRALLFVLSLGIVLLSAGCSGGSSNTGGENESTENKTSLPGASAIFRTADARSALPGTLANQTFAIEGHFIHYASGAYEWIYIPANGSGFYKLAGMDAATGNLIWDTPNESSRPSVSISSTMKSVTFGAVAPGTGESYTAMIASKSFDIQGHFIHFGNGAYDWIYITADGQYSYKLTGMNASNGNLTWDTETFAGINVNSNTLTVTFESETPSSSSSNNSSSEQTDENDNDGDSSSSSSQHDEEDDNEGSSSSRSDDENDDEHDNESSSSSSYNSGTTSSSSSSSSAATVALGDYTLLAWNDLGMHCVDGNDYSVFSILPPYNNLHAQLKRKNGSLVTSGVTLTYEAEASANGVLNTTSLYDNANSLKTNFWSYVDKLFGTTLADDTGLAGMKMQSTTPNALKFNSAHGWWEAEGIPITPIDDNGAKNFYPRVKVIAKDNSGAIIASAITVLPVSDEMDCRACHGSSSGYNSTQPFAGWVNDADTQKDFKRNILRLHDDKHPNAVKDNQSALAAAGYNYDAAGLEATQEGGTPILCASCHSSNALPGTGIAGIKPLTQALHGKHANARDPESGLTLDNIGNRTSCYLCHPGQATQCLRGAMGNAKNPDGTAKMDCQSCHGTMSQVGASTRQGWLEQPNCQACHQNGQQYTSAVNSDGSLRQALDTRFATNANTPAAGYSLYRFSKGHGNLQCESCHGATHAIYPSHEAGDNILSESLQGHSGTVAECTACHSSVPMTKDKGPHGMHTVGQAWVSGHEDYAEGNTQSCQACHGTDYRGSVLSKTWTARSFRAEDKTVNYPKGKQVGCYDCHNGPSGE